MNKKVKPKSYQRLTVKADGNVNNISKRRILSSMEENKLHERILLSLLCIDNGVFRMLEIDWILICLLTSKIKQLQK